MSINKFCFKSKPQKDFVLFASYFMSRNHFVISFDIDAKQGNRERVGYGNMPKKETIKQAVIYVVMIQIMN